jgi:hypothetical protein
LFVNNLNNGLNHGLTGIAGKANKDDSRRLGAADKNQPAEIFVFRQQDAFSNMGKAYHSAVVGLGHRFTDSHNIAALGLQGSDNGKITGFHQPENAKRRSSGGL